MQYQDFTEMDRSIDVIGNYYNSTPSAYVHSFGCQQNVNDGEKIKGGFAADRLQPDRKRKRCGFDYFQYLCGARTRATAGYMVILGRLNR